MTTHNDDGSIIEDVVLSQESGNYGVDIPKNVWHKLESLEAGSVIFECKEGPFVEHEVEGILEVSNLGSAEPRSYGNVQKYTERDLAILLVCFYSSEET